MGTQTGNTAGTTGAGSSGAADYAAQAAADVAEARATAEIDRRTNLQLQQINNQSQREKQIAEDSRAAARAG
jgi:hypothetical protein